MGTTKEERDRAARDAESKIDMAVRSGSRPNSDNERAKFVLRLLDDHNTIEARAVAAEAEVARLRPLASAVEQFATAAALPDNRACERAMVKSTDALYRAWCAYAALAKGGE